MKDAEAKACAPINHLPHAVGVTDAEIMLGADGKDGFKDAGEQKVGA